MDKKSAIRAMVVGDSRIRHLVSYPNPNKEQYSLDILCFGGAKLKKICEETVKHLKENPPNEKYIVYIAAGICELSLKESHRGGTEISPTYETKVFQHILECKETIRAYQPNCVVGIATIPILDFARVNGFYEEIGYLTIPKYSPEQNKIHQDYLSQMLADLNKEIFAENQIPQYVPEVGLIYPKQWYLHQNIEKVSKKIRGPNVKLIKRIPTTALFDGIHPSSKVLDSWNKGLHNNLIDISGALHDPITTLKVGTPI
jgi:hypothetical protein